MYLFAFVWNTGTTRVWRGFALGGLVRYLVSYLSTKIHLRRLNKVHDEHR